MNIASSSASFSAEFASGRLSMLEWLDLCAHDLAVDAVTVALTDLPRSDDEFLAQVKKTAVDLGLTVAACGSDRALTEAGAFTTAVDIAAKLGAPLVIANTPEASDDPAAWPAFVETAKAAAREAKRVNIPLAVRNARGTLCEFEDALGRLAKDVDSAWLRFALDAGAFRGVDDLDAILPKTIVAMHLSDPARGASDRRLGPRDVVRALHNFRGHIVVETPEATLEEIRTELDALNSARARFTLERLGEASTPR